MGNDSLVLAGRLTERAGRAAGLLADGVEQPAQVSRCGRRSRLLWAVLTATGVAALLWAAVVTWRKAAPPGVTGRLRALTGLDPLAVCVDGSPAAYYWKEGDPGSRTWIVDLEGGGWCYDESSCKQRCSSRTSYLCSSRTWKEERVLGAGLLSPKLHSELSGANRAFVPYCTSDAHMGDAEAFGMQFRGARVLEAVLADLVQLGLGRGPSRPLVILGGQSAGGRGAMVNLEYVRDMLGPELAQRVDVMGFLDSPLWIDVPPYSAHFVGFAAECRGVFSYANVTRLGRQCEAKHPGDDRWKCIMGEYRMPYVRTPYLLVASQYDAFQLDENSIDMPKGANETAYADSLAKRTRDVVNTLRVGWQDGGIQNAVFSWTCHDHASSCSTRGFDRRTCGPDKITLDSATLQFLGLEPLTGYPRTLEWVDNCSGINCGVGCGINLDFLASEKNKAVRAEVANSDLRAALRNESASGKR